MKKHFLIICIAVALGGCDQLTGSSAGSGGVQVKASEPLKLYGVNLATASRAQLRDAMAKAGLTMVTSNDLGDDVYSAKGALKEADTLTLRYTKQNEFAVATYVFPSFVDPGQIARVKAMLVQKYGEPDETEGNDAVGPASATWQREGDMSVLVQRDWPSTTTRLYYAHRGHFQQLMDEEQKVRQQELDADLKARSNAF